MAYRSVFLPSFLLIICMSSVAHCSLLGDDIVDKYIIQDLTGISQVSILGVVGCGFPSPVIRPNEPSLPAGINVAFTCDAGRTVISDAVTDTNGFFKITLNTLFTPLFHPKQCDKCRIVVRSTSGGCVVLPGRRGAILAPIRCNDPTVEKRHGDEQEGGRAVQYKAEPFYYEPSY